MIDINLLTLAEAYELRVAVNNMIAKYEEDAMDTLMQGKPHPNFKLKQGNKRRIWTDKDSLVQTLKDAGYTNKDIYDVKLKGIPAIEKLTKDTDVELDTFIEVSRNKSTLVYTGEG